ncbi:MAG: hypothetical protein R2812_04780 [Gelidibacter sp.]
MNKLCILAFALFSVCFTSCQFSENIYLNEDGSGKMAFVFNGDQLMEMAGDKFSEDSKKKMDTTIVFKDFLEQNKDSISKLSDEEQQKLKTLENFSIRTLMDSEAKKMEFDMTTDFKSISELQDMFSTMNKMQSLTNATGTSPSITTNKTTQLHYMFDGHKFSRKATIIDEALLKKQTDSLESAKDMFASSKYTLNYHFPSAIKSVSNNNAVLSDDRKNLILEYNLIDYLKNPKGLDLEVILED